VSDAFGTVLAVKRVKGKRHMDITAASSGCKPTRRSGRPRSAPRTRGGRIYAAERADTRGSRGLSLGEIAIIVALIAAVIVAAVLSGAGTAPEPVHESTIKVGAGESLWAIASAHPMPGQTTQQTVDTIRRVNHLTGSSVAEGSVLRISTVTGSAVALAR
jgi:LysM domain